MLGDTIGFKFKHFEPHREVNDKVGHMEVNTSSEVENDSSHRMFTSRVGPPDFRTASCTLFLEEISTGSMKLEAHLISCCRGMLS
jgi:hypothetical protein